MKEPRNVSHLSTFHGNVQSLLKKAVEEVSQNIIVTAKDNIKNVFYSLKNTWNCNDLFK